MSEKAKNQIVVLEPVTDTVSELLRMINERNQAEVVRLTNADEAIQYARQNAPCMFMLCMSTNTDIPPTFNTLKKIKSDIKAGFLKVTLVSKIRNPQLQKLVQEIGITDYIEEPIPARTLQFKANLQLKAVDNFRRQRELKKAAEEKVTIKTFEKKGGPEPATGGTAIKPQTKQALKMADDTFLIKNTAIKKSGKKVVVEMDGPDPETGEWKQEETKPGEEQAWRWEPKDEEGKPEASSDDGWVCRGEKPQFKPNTKKWQAVAEKPELFLKKKKTKVAVKLSMDEQGEVTLAEDSEEAEENLKKNRAKGERIRKKKGLPELGVPVPEIEPEKEAVPFLLKKTDKKERAAPKGGRLGETQENQAAEEEETLELGADKDAVKAMRMKKRRERNKKEEDEEEEETEETGEVDETGKPVLRLKAKTEKKKRERTLKSDDGEETEEEEGAEPLALLKKDKAPKERAALSFLKKKKEARPTAEAPLLPEAEEEEAAEGEASLSLLGKKDSKIRAKKPPRKKVKVKKKDENGNEIEVEEEVEESAEEQMAREIEEESAKLELPAFELSAEDKKAAEEDAAKEERKKEREIKKVQLMEEIHRELTAPEPDEIPAAEEARLRKKYKSEDRRDLTAADLVRKERLEKVKKMRAEIDELDEADFEDDMPANLRLTKLGSERELQGMNVDVDAFGDLPAEEAEEDTRLSKLKKDKKKKRDKDGKITAEEEGFAEGEESGDSGGDEEEKRKKGRLKSRRERGLESGDEDGAEESAAEKDSSGWDEEEEEEEGESRGDFEDAGEEKGKKGDRRFKDKGKDAEDKDLLARKAKDDPEMLGDKSFAEDEPAGDFRDLTSPEKLAAARRAEDALAEAGQDKSAKKDRGDGSDIEDELAEQKRQKREKAEADAKATEIELKEQKEKREREKAAQAEYADKKEKERKEKAQLEAEEAKAERKESGALSEEEKAARGEGESAESFEKTRKEIAGSESGDLSAEFGSSGEESPGGKSAMESLDEKLGKMGEKSASMKDFLERRKKRQEEGAATENSDAKNSASQSSPAHRTSHLGVFVALSDSLGFKSDRKLLNVLRALDCTFPNCAGAFAAELDAEGNPAVSVSPTIAAGELIPSAACHLAAIDDGKTGTILGYLVVKMISPRENFEPSEIETLQKAAELLRPLLQLRAETAGDKPEAKAA